MSYIARLTAIAQYAHKQPQQIDTKTPIGTPLANTINNLQKYNFIDSLDQITITPKLQTNINNTEKTIDILFVPLQTFRNLGRNTNVILTNVINGAVIGTSCDVNWHGFVDYANKENTTTQLTEWITAKQQANRPIQSTYELHNNWHREYAKWQTTIENKFITEKQQTTPYQQLQTMHSKNKEDKQIT